VRLKAFITNNTFVKHLSTKRCGNYISRLNGQARALDPDYWQVSGEAYTAIMSEITPRWARLLPSHVKHAEVIDMDTLYAQYRSLDLTDISNLRFWAMLMSAIFTMSRGNSWLDGNLLWGDLVNMAPGHKHNGGYAI
jgi:hypothetical protein